MERTEEILINEIKNIISGIRGEPKALYLLPELVLSIIHKVNNKMTPLIGYAQFLMKDSEGQTLERLKKIYNSGVVASSILGSLFEYLKTFPFPRRVCELGEFVKEIVEEDERLKKIDFKILVNEPINLPINKVQMKEVIRKIIDNSLEVLDKPEKRIEINISREENSAIIEFWDNGEGIDSGNLNNIFDPFFTTKEGRAGLGLSFVHGIVKNHGGDIIAESEKGRWTKIKVSLPITPFEWREERILLLAPENEFYRLLFELAKSESMNMEWEKSKKEIDFKKYTHIIVDEEIEVSDEFIKDSLKFNLKVIFVGEKREGVILVKKPASLIGILSKINS